MYKPRLSVNIRAANVRRNRPNAMLSKHVVRGVTVYAVVSQRCVSLGVAWCATFGDQVLIKRRGIREVIL